MLMGWGTIDTFFFGSILAMSSAVITGKILSDLNRLAEPNAEIILTVMIVEDILGVVIFTLAVALFMGEGGTVTDWPSVATLLGSVAGLYAFFMLMATYVVPRVYTYINKIEEAELFVLFSLAVIFLTATLTQYMRVSIIIGAFFIGVCFSETDLPKRFKSELLPFRHAFAAIFFVSFGMLINPNSFFESAEVLILVLLGIGILLICEVFILSLSVWLIGYPGKTAIPIGVGALGRGEEAVLFASVGNKTASVTKASALSSFTGVFCLVACVVESFLLKHSGKIVRMVERGTPKTVAFSGSILSRTLREYTTGKHTDMKAAAMFVTFIVIVMGVVLTGGLLHVVFACVAAFTTMAIVLNLHKKFESTVPPIFSTSVDAIGQQHIVKFVTHAVSGALFSVILITTIWQYYPQVTIFVFAGFFLYLYVLMYGLRAKLSKVGGP
jgi:CPA2 family monovalent cation:H+ antiporter-2